MYLRPDIVIIFDRVITIDPNSTKKWILHFKNEPIINNEIVSSVNGNGKIFLKMLHPITSASQVNKLQLTADMTTPNWYIEIQPSQLQKQNNFLNVIYATDASTQLMPEAILVDGTTLLGSQISDWIVMFSKEETQLEIGQFNITGTGRYKSIIADLVPGSTYSIYLDGNHIGNYVAKESGLIEFEMLLNGSHTINISSGITDNINPGKITDLSATTGNQAGTVILTWTATGDDGNVGTASSYIIKYYTSAINDSNWNSAFDIEGEPLPQPAGNSETYTVTGLIPGQTYYFAIRALDKAGNMSDISNSPSVVAGKEPLGKTGKPNHIDNISYEQ